MPVFGGSLPRHVRATREIHFVRRTINVLLISAALLANSPANAAYVTTGYVSDLDISMDNGKTYFRGFPVSGNCLYERLELRDTGDYFGSVENAKRMYVAILSARLTGKRIRLGYNDTDGPECRVAEVWVEWN